jgi:hypothetical protein
MAQKLLRLSAASFPMSGILTLTGLEKPENQEPRKIVVSLRQDGLFEMPLRIDGHEVFDWNAGADLIAEEINKRLMKSWKNIDTLAQALP